MIAIGDLLAAGAFGSISKLQRPMLWYRAGDPEADASETVMFMLCSLSRLQVYKAFDEEEGTEVAWNQVQLPAQAACGRWMLSPLPNPDAIVRTCGWCSPAACGHVRLLYPTT